MGLSDLSLTHFSAKPIGKLRDADWLKRGGAYKPSGLWVSVDGEDDWPSWCEAEGFGLDSLKCQTRITLAPDSNVLLISKLASLDSFHRTFRGARYEGIRWKQVADIWDGIIIAPYQYDRRFTDDFSWYYGWDCASGCIWHKRAIAKAESVADVRDGCGSGASPRVAPPNAPEDQG